MRFCSWQSYDAQLLQCGQKQKAPVDHSVSFRALTPQPQVKSQYFSGKLSKRLNLDSPSTDIDDPRDIPRRKSASGGAGTRWSHSLSS